MLTSAHIKSKAASLGFDLCGIAPADDFPELSFLAEWLDRGYAGEMAWMRRTAERRSDVRNVVPGARSVIVTATLYNTDRPYSHEQASNRNPAPGARSPEPGARLRTDHDAWTSTRAGAIPGECCVDARGASANRAQPNRMAATDR